ncbi:E3 ubiquitin-protein ligase TRIM39-like [Gastrophryne carolinensis]
MASADLRKELECSVCLSIYTDPVTLKCGHNFCRVCIDRVLETQERSGRYSCPECREKFQERPELIRNLKLRNIIENVLSTESDQSEVRFYCTYCIDSPVPAVKSCLLCEASLCKKHFKFHSKSPEHVLTDPSTVLGNRKCFEHKKMLEYYCTEDSVCICVSCYVNGEHQGHQMESLDKASERKKKALKDVLQKVSIRRKETEGRVRSLQENRKEAQQKATDMCERVTALFRELRIQVTELEKRVLSEVSRQEQQASLSLSHLIQQLEIKKDELSRKMHHIEELCNTTDPLTLLQEPDTGDLCDTEEGGNEDRETHDKTLSDGGDLDMSLLSQQFHTLSDIIREVNVGIYMEGAADILLDVDTAHNNLHISHDRKTVSYVGANQNLPETPKRFKNYAQVLSSCSFSSGRHYWEVDVGGACWWIIGMCYPSIDREAIFQSVIGRNNKSWALRRIHNKMSVLHDGKVTPLPALISGNKVRINLDYEAGKISFYESGNPSRHLHTFTATFTEPLHAGLRVWKESCNCGINTDVAAITLG